jgi:NADPH:quinone reductase-like Zn-dependent oxidoreductase
MLAAVREDYGEPETVALRDVARPTVGDQEVLVELGRQESIRGSGISSLAFRTSSGSRDLGCGTHAPLVGGDVAGRVEAVGRIATGMITNVGYGVVSDLHAVDPAQAATAWATLDAVQNGLGGGNEVVGGLWVLMLSVARGAHRSCPDGPAISAC